MQMRYASPSQIQMQMRYANPSGHILFTAASTAYRGKAIYSHIESYNAVKSYMNVHALRVAAVTRYDSWF